MNAILYYDCETSSESFINLDVYRNEFDALDVAFLAADCESAKDVELSQFDADDKTSHPAFWVHTISGELTGCYFIRGLNVK